MCEYNLIVLTTTSNVSSKKTNNKFDIETHNKLVTEYLLVNPPTTFPPQKIPKTEDFQFQYIRR